jgi:transcriptional regulator of acetoin/glycerol metabolism
MRSFQVASYANNESIRAEADETEGKRTECFRKEVSATAMQRIADPRVSSRCLLSYSSRRLIRALTACKGRVGGPDGAAARLGMNRTTFFSRLKKLGIYAKQYA